MGDLKATPGPWETVKGYLVGSNGERVLFSGHLGLCLAPLPADNANDSLAKAAPELYEALLELRFVGNQMARRKAARAKADAALAKARGEHPQATDSKEADRG